MVIIVNVLNEENSEKLSRYGKQAESAIQKYGGKFLGRGGRHETKEGADFSRNVVVEFDSYDIAITAYGSEEYKKALPLLEGGADRMYAIVEGYE